MGKSSRAAQARQTSGGFTWLEIVVVLTVVVMLAGALFPVFNGTTKSGKVSKVLKLVESLQAACQRHKLDTGNYAIEYSGNAAKSRHLSARQTVRGWKGPYIELPLTSTHNPFSSSGIHVYNSALANGWLKGFDLDGDQVLDVTGSCNMLWLAGVSDAEARELDTVLDAGIAGAWEKTGRVAFEPTKKYLFIMLHQ
jgi:type II secretory pathway pseudopilin PulG